MKPKNDSLHSTLNYYERSAVSLVKRYEQAEISTLQHLLATSFRGHRHLLEIGSGSGRDASFLQEEGFRVTAMDGSAQMIRQAQALHPGIQFIHHVLPEVLPFQSRCFEGVYAIAVLMHLDLVSLKNTLREIHRVLDAEGLFILSVPVERDDTNTDGLDEKGRFFLTMPEAKWRQILNQAGFTVHKVNTSPDGLNRKAIRWITITNKKTD